MAYPDTSSPEFREMQRYIRREAEVMRLYVEKGGEVIAEPNMDLLNDKDLEQLWDSWHLQADVRSNGIILYRDGTSIAISSGQQERVGAINLALQKAREKGHSTKGSYLSTCGFIPNVDNVEQAKKGEIKAIVQPGGSIEDANVINAANESGIGQVFTGSRFTGPSISQSSSLTVKLTSSPSQFVPSTVNVTLCPSVIESTFQVAFVSWHC